MSGKSRSDSEFIAVRKKSETYWNRDNTNTLGLLHTEAMLKELDTIANELNIGRQAVIKTYLRQALDQHYIAKPKVD